MAPNFQSSFIPTGPMTDEKVFQKKKVGILGVLSVFLLIISIVGAGGIYFYKGIIEKEIQSMESELALAEKNINKEEIDKMAQFSKKLGIAKSIIANHQVISGVLNTISSTTVSTVQFKYFDYGGMKDGGLSVSLKGEATSYASVALQESVFSQEKYFKLVSFSNLSLTTDGTVSFNAEISVDPKISIYALQ